MDNFNFYGLGFKDRKTYQHYKDYKRLIDVQSSTHTKGFRMGIDDDCLIKLERQFKKEGYYTHNTRSYPIRQYDKETEKEQDYVYLEVGTSHGITQKNRRN